VEGVELIEQGLLEKKFENVFSFFINILDIDVL
jgi:hypothetical protein